MIGLIIGLGEVGSSLKRVLEGTHEIYARDIKPIGKVPQPDMMHICLRYSPDFLRIVRGYIEQYQPAVVDICTTVPPGTTAELGPIAIHSTTRGLHPNLDRSLKTFTKHLGGYWSSLAAKYYEAAGIETKIHARPETTELAHILSNAVYGVNLMLADELEKICRHYGVDYTQAVIGYNETSNAGYQELDQPSKMRMILTPPRGLIGGHCVRQGAALLPKEVRPPMINALAEA